MGDRLNNGTIAGPGAGALRCEPPQEGSAWTKPGGAVSLGAPGGRLQRPKAMTKRHRARWDGPRVTRAGTLYSELPSFMVSLREPGGALEFAILTAARDKRSSSRTCGPASCT